jgi:hypothetical protein
MSLARLRRVLSSPLEVNIESSPSMVQRVAAAAASRAHLSPKTPAVYAPLAGSQTISIRPIEFLRKVGELTTPKTINLSRLSASWATRRYFWAIADPGANTQAAAPFKLSRDARSMDRHQKTLLSDEFGMGFAGIVAERLLSAPEFVEVDYAISNPQRFFGAKASTKRRPDFLMWGNPNALFVVECKGSQTTRASVVSQLRRGLEQLPSIQTDGVSQVALVIAAHLYGRGTTVHVIDPPNDESDSSGEVRQRVDKSIDRIGEDRYAVSDLTAFREKLQAGVNLSRLRWAGQHAAAENIEESISGRQRREDVANAPVERLDSPLGEFLGSTTPLAPELGSFGPRIFRGVRSDVLAQFDIHDDNAVIGDEVRENFGPEDPRFSAGDNGMCLAILGLGI